MDLTKLTFRADDRPCGMENMQLTFSERESALKDLDTELDIKTRAKMVGTKLQYHEAMKLVASENPDLDRRRTRLYMGGDQ